MLSVRTTRNQLYKDNMIFVAFVILLIQTDSRLNLLSRDFSLRAILQSVN